MTDEQPKVSIGLPVFNGERFLEGALESLLAQTFEDFEIIISDNASTDTTGELCRLYADKDSRIHYYRSSHNRGLSWNHNYVLALARGEYFKWSGHDDLCHPDLLRRCVEILDQRPEVVLCQAGVADIDVDDNQIFTHTYDFDTGSPKPSVRFKDLLMKSGGHDIYGVMRTDAARKSRPLGSYHHHAERVKVVSLSLHGQFHQVPEVLFFHREHDSSSQRAHTTTRSSAPVLDPRRGNRLFHPQIRLGLEYVYGFAAGIWQAPLSPIERCRCFRHLGEWAIARTLRRAPTSGRRCSSPALRAGDVVEVRSEEEILSTLDTDGKLESLPFMPEMLEFCGRRFRVGKVAVKTCDTIDWTGSHRMERTVHLEDLRCDGRAHGGCQAGCLLYWKEAWLKRPAPSVDAVPRPPGLSVAAGSAGRRSPCTRATLFARTRVGVQAPPDDVFSCQATELMRAAGPRLRFWHVRQYWRDVRAGNVASVTMARGLVIMAFSKFQAANRRFLPRLPLIRGAADFPFIQGKLSRTPRQRLDIQPGELVEIKSRAEIIATLDTKNKNRGLLFEKEMSRFCGKQTRVLRQVDRIIDEKTGKMFELPGECLVLDGVICAGFYRDFCPRATTPYWREIWLRRVEPSGPRASEAPGERADQAP